MKQTEDAFIIMSSVIELLKNFQWVRFRSIAEHKGSILFDHVRL